MLAAAALYFVVENNFFIKKHGVYRLPKATLNLHDTFTSLDNKRPSTVLQNDELRDAGIGDLMVELGMLTEEKKNRLEAKYTYTE